MTPEQLERAAADRVRRMGYPDDLSDAERWRQYNEDANLVVSSNTYLWERVRELEAALASLLPFCDQPDWPEWKRAIDLVDAVPAGGV